MTFESQLFNLSNDRQICIQFSPKLKNFIEIRGTNGYLVRLSWVMFRGNTNHRFRKQNDGPYILSLDGQGIARLDFEGLSYRERDAYYIVEASNQYGRTEIKIFKDSLKDLEYEMRHVMYPMPSMQMNSAANLELFVSYQSGLKNQRKFRTDSNGLMMVDRVYGFEGKYNEIPFNIEMNMYPVNRIISTKDETS